MSDVRVTLDCWCSCGGGMTVDLVGVADVDKLHDLFREVHSGEGHGVATKEQAAAIRRKQRRGIR